MDFKSLFQTALVSLLSNKVRSFLAMLGIIIGVSSVILLVAIGSGIKSFVVEQFEGLGSNLITVLPGKVDFSGHGGVGAATPVGGILSSKLSLDDVETILDKSQSVESANGIVQFSQTVKYDNQQAVYFIVGTGQDYVATRNVELFQGEFISSSDVNSSRRVAVLGASVVESLFEGEEPIDKNITVGDLKYTVIGVFEETGAFGGQNADEQVFIPVTAAFDQLGKKNLAFIQAKATSADSVKEAMAQIEDALLQNHKEEDFTIIDQQSILSTVSGVLQALTLGLSGIAAISLLVGGIGIMNIMLVSVTQRTREIGLRKALGATSTIILLQFLTESVVLCLIGGTIGLGIGVIGSLIIGKFIKTEITILSVVLALGVSTLVGIVFGVLPARQASKLSPIEALRYE